MRFFLTHKAFFFQAEDGIRYIGVTGVQTCALPILRRRTRPGLVGLGPQAAEPRDARHPQPPRGGARDRRPRRGQPAAGPPVSAPGALARSEERRVGEECSSRWSPDHYKKTNITTSI